MDEEQKQEEKQKKEKKPLINRFSQFIVFFCMLYGLFLTTISYLFSYLGKEPLVDLSSVIVQTIVAPCVVWLCQNALCNIFENNKLAFSTPLTRLEQEDALSQESLSTETPELTETEEQQNELSD